MGETAEQWHVIEDLGLKLQVVSRRRYYNDASALCSLVGSARTNSKGQWAMRITLLAVLP
jgi:hypothetical protein